MVRVIHLLDRLRHGFWFVPALLSGIAVALALGLLKADRRIADDVPASLGLCHHASRAVQADRVIHAVGRDLDAVVDSEFPEPLEGETAGPDLSAPPGDGHGTPIPAPASGYVIRVDTGALVCAAQDGRAIIHVNRRPGDFVIAGEPLARVVPGGRSRSPSARWRPSTSIPSPLAAASIGSRPRSRG